MQADRIAEGAFEEHSQEFMRQEDLLPYIIPGLQAMFDKTVSEPLPPQLDALIDLMRLKGREG